MSNLNTRNGWPWIEEIGTSILNNINWPKISIVTPSYNQGEYIEEAILSVLSQNYPNLEYIIIDGGSNDNTVEIIKKYEKRITYWCSEHDKGQAHAIAKGFEIASGYIINWLNSDDILERGSLFKIAEAFIMNPNFQVVYGNVTEFDNNGYCQKKESAKDKLPFRYLFEFPYAQPSVFFTKKIYDEVGKIDINYRFTMDYDLFIRMALRTDFLRIESFISRFRWHELSKSNTLGDVAEEEKLKVFSSLLRTLKFNEAIVLLNELGLYRNSEASYTAGKKIFYEKRFFILLEFLYPLIQHWYVVGNLKKIRLIFNFFKKNKPELLNDIRINRKRLVLSLPNFIIIFLRKSRLFCKEVFK